MPSWQLLADRRIVVLGPTAPLIPRVKNRFREQMLLKGPIAQTDKDVVLGAYRRLIEKRKGTRAIELRWDVDPESFS